MGDSERTRAQARQTVLDTAVSMPLDPLLGWAGLDRDGRTVATGGLLAAAGRLPVGAALGALVVGPEAVSNWLAAAGSAAAARAAVARHEVPHASAADTAHELATASPSQARAATGETIAPAADTAQSLSPVGPSPLAIEGQFSPAARPPLLQGDAQSAPAARPSPAEIDAQRAGDLPAPLEIDALLPGEPLVPVRLRLRAACGETAGLRVALEIYRRGAPVPLPGSVPSWSRAAAAPGGGETSLSGLSAPTLSPHLVSPWQLGSVIYAGTVVPSAAHPCGLIRFVLHPVALPRLRAVDDLAPWLAASAERLAACAAALGVAFLAARTGVREITVWVPDGAACGALCERWLAAVNASPLPGPAGRLQAAPGAAWCVLPADGQVLSHLLDALDGASGTGDLRRPRPAIAVGSGARERDIDERREPLTATMIELARSGRARLGVQALVDAPTGLVCALHLRAEFRSLFAAADLVDHLPDLIEDPVAAAALTRWMSGELAAWPAAALRLPQAGRLQLRIAAAQLARPAVLLELARVLRARADEQPAGTHACLLLPESALHRNAYALIDAAALLAPYRVELGVDDWRGLLPAEDLARSGVRVAGLHRSVTRDLAERPAARARLADLLARARAAGIDVQAGALANAAELDAAVAAGALLLGGPLFWRARARAGLPGPVAPVVPRPGTIAAAEAGGARPA